MQLSERANASSSAPLQLSMRRKALYACIPLSVLLFLTEATLWIVGYESPVADPYDSFVLRRPLFQSDGDTLSTSPARRRFFHPQSFSGSKEANTKRIFAFGGSTTYGYLLEDPQKDSYLGQLGRMLAKEMPGLRFETINCGGLSYASYRLVDLVEECLNYSPDLIIIMSGHNEFLESRHYADLKEATHARDKFWYNLRTVRLVQHMSNDLKPRRPVLDDLTDPNAPVQYLIWNVSQFDGVLDHYSRNLHHMLSACKRNRTPVIICTCASNLLDQPPFMTSKISDEDFRARARRAMALTDAGKYDEALVVAEDALREDPGSTFFHYIAGLCYFDMKRFEEAKESLILAKDTDQYPNRALSSFNECVRATARERGVELFDAEQLIADNADHGLPGNELFFDQVHPKLEGHRIFANGLKEISVRLIGSSEN